jgi:hypothetical protein
VLHGQRINDFDGGFAEGGVQHGARARRRNRRRRGGTLRRVRERKSTRRSLDERRRQHSVRRPAKRAVLDAERRGTECER